MPAGFGRLSPYDGGGSCALGPPDEHFNHTKATCGKPPRGGRGEGGRGRGGGGKGGAGGGGGRLKESRHRLLCAIAVFRDAFSQREIRRAEVLPSNLSILS